MRVSNNIKIKCLIIICCILVTLLGYFCYLSANLKLKEPQIEKEIQIEKEVVVETVLVETVVEVEKIVTTEVYIETKPKPYYNVSNVEREMLARLLYREAGAASLECQKMVISVVFNRYDAANGERTLEDIVYQAGQFSPASILYKTTPTELNYQAVDEIIMYGSVLPKYIKYFRADYHFSWEGYIGYTDLEGTYFGYFSKDVH